LQGSIEKSSERLERVGKTLDRLEILRVLSELKKHWEDLWIKCAFSYGAAYIAPTPRLQISRPSRLPFRTLSPVVMVAIRRTAAQAGAHLVARLGRLLTSLARSCHSSRREPSST
jgi:hypothetical protein